MRRSFITAECLVVEWFSAVYEIRWAYINPEVSLAYPHRVQAYSVPDDYPIWKHLCVIKRKCFKLNRKNPDYKPGTPKPLYDLTRVHPFQA